MTPNKTWSKFNTLNHKIQNRQSTIINIETNAMLFLEHITSLKTHFLLNMKKSLINNKILVKRNRNKRLNKEK